VISGAPDRPRQRADSSKPGNAITKIGHAVAADLFKDGFLLSRPVAASINSIF
jgi:hypothetical protein